MNENISMEFGAEYLEQEGAEQFGAGGGGWKCIKDIETGSVTCYGPGGLISIT